MRTDLLLLIILLTVAPAPPLFAAAQSSSEPAANYTKISSTTSLIIILLVSAILCSGFVSIYIRLCYDDTADGTNPRYTADGRPRRVSQSGLDPKLIASFPIFNYSEIKHLKTGKGALSCAVCLREFDDNEMLRLLTKCDHVFHPECIDAWLASHFTCPICRANLSEGIESTQSTVDGDSSSEVRNQNQISITVDQNQRTETETGGRLRMLPRPHSTGHSLVQLGEDWERYTLRFPNGVSRQVDMLDRVGRSDRWDFLTMTRPPPFFSRNSTKPDVVDGEVTAVGTSGILFLKSVKSPFDCLAGKSEHMSTDLPV